MSLLDEYKGKEITNPSVLKMYGVQTDQPQPRDFDEFKRMAQMGPSAIDIGLSAVGGPVMSGVIAASKQFGAATGEDTRSAPEQFLTGAAKGVASTALGIGELGARGLTAVTKPLVDLARPAVQSITEPLAGKLGVGPTQEQALESMGKLREEVTAPKGAVEQAGFGTEQIAEFLFPSSAIGKVGKATEGASIGSKLLQLGKQGGKEALVSGAIAAGQRGNLDKEVVDTAILAGSIPLLTPVFSKAADLVKKGLNKAAEIQISRLIKPNKNAFLFGKNPSRALIDEGIVANSFDDLSTQTNNRLSDIGKEIKAVVSKAPNKTANIQGIIQNNVDDFGKKVVDKATWKAYTEKIQQLTGEFSPDLKTGELIKVADRDLTRVNAPAVWDMQKRAGKLTQWNGVAGEREANKQLHKLYRDLGTTLDDLAPGTKKLQTRYADMLGASKSIEARKAVAERNTDIVRILGGAALGGVVSPAGGEGWEGRAFNAVAGGLIAKLGNSPALRTRLAQAMGKKSVPLEKLTPVVEAVLKEITSNQD